MLKKSRNLDDRVEYYDYDIAGRCCCGQPLIKVIGSSCTSFTNGVRYIYPGDNTAACIFRCKSCKEQVELTFIEDQLLRQTAIFLPLSMN